MKRSTTDGIGLCTLLTYNSNFISIKRTSNPYRTVNRGIKARYNTDKCSR